MTPKVSILVPIYGVENFIERCAISLFEQTFEDIEFIFINDCTPDKSIDILLDVLSRYPERRNQVKIISNPKNLGIAANRNNAIAAASGIYTLFVDSDDFIETNMISLMYNEIVNQKADICICDYFMEWEESTIVKRQDVKSLTKEQLLRSMISGQTEVCLWNKLVKRELYTVNDVKTIEGISLGEDFLLTVKLAFHAQKIVKVDIPLYHYIKFNANSHTSQVKMRHIENMNTIIEELDRFVKLNNAHELYGNDVLELKLRTKLGFLLKVDSELIKFVQTLYPESSRIEGDVILPLRDRMTLKVTNLKSSFLLIQYLNVFKKVFGLYQKIKKR